MNTLKKILQVSIALLATIARGSTASADEPSNLSTQNVIYGRKAGLALTMDVYAPLTKSNKGAIMRLFSGDLVSERIDINRNDSNRFTEYRERGYTVFEIFHGSTPIFPVDEIVADIHRAARYIRHNANTYGIDPNRIAVMGISSGGYLAAHLGVSGGENGPPFPIPDITRVSRYDPIERESSKVAAFVSFCGPTDWLNYDAEGKSVLEYKFQILPTKKTMYFSAPFEFRNYDHKTNSLSKVTDAEEIKRRLRSTSPVSLVTADSASGLLIYGTDDPNVPIRQAETLEARMKVAGVYVELLARKGVGHDVYQKGDEKLVADWLDKIMKKKEN